MRPRAGTRRCGPLPAIAILAVLPLLETASAQSVKQPAGAAMTFEVASVKRQPPPMRPGTSLQDIVERTPSRTFRGNRFQARNATAAWLIREAHGDRYRLPEQVLGGPEWVNQDRFEIEAVAPNVAPSGRQSPAPDAVLEMLRNLLATRFKLRVREEMREGPVYALVRAYGDGRLGDGIRVSDRDCTDLIEEKNGERASRRECVPQFGDDALRLVGHPIERFVRTLESRVGRPVINETGLSGTVDLEFPRSVSSNFTGLSRVGPDSELFTALREVLGLKLESRRAPIPVLFVEHIERPADN